MNHNFVKGLITLYLRIAKHFNRKLILPNKSLGYFNLPMIDFSNLINKYPYKSDPLGGAWDYIDKPDEFFNEGKTSGRDCDDWARMWSLWGVYHKYRAYEYVICDASSLKTIFKTMHCFTLLEKDNKCYLLNYRQYGPYRSKEKAIEALIEGWGYSNNSVVVLDREITLP